MLDLGTRLELFVDRYLIERLQGAWTQLHEPVLTPPVPGAPRVCYSTILLEQGLYRRYERGVRPGYRGPQHDGHPGEVTYYLESRDGRRWTRPPLGLVRLNGSAANNAVLAGASMCSHNFTPFIDANPRAGPARRYKALGGVHPGGGLYAWSSPDGLRWRPLRRRPVLTSREFAFDSQNVSFWSVAEGQYLCYFRTWQTPHGPLRTISRSTSPDFVHWTRPVPLNPNLPGEHLYTSNTQPYFRAPHLYVALPTRFLPDRGASTDILFMSCRAGALRYDRPFTEAFIRPGLEPERWGNRANYAAWNVVPTGPTEMSIYVSDRRYALRTDGFASVRAGAGGGELLTRVVCCPGGELVVNLSTSAAGSLRVELRSAENRPIPGYRLTDCPAIVGDQIERLVSWNRGADLSRLAGRPVRLRMVLADADLYGLRFRLPA